MLVVGDLNAKMSKDRDAKGWYYHQRTNRNGNLLKETMQSAKLEATNHRFCKKPGKLGTFLEDSTGIKSQIGYILVPNKWMNSVKNNEAYNSYSSVRLDVVGAPVNLRPRRCDRISGLPLRSG